MRVFIAKPGHFSTIEMVRLDGKKDKMMTKFLSEVVSVATAVLAVAE